MKKNPPNITPEQHEQINKYLPKTWDHIYHKILSQEQRKEMKKNKNFLKYVCFTMEEHYKSIANEFGLNALLDEDE